MRARRSNGVESHLREKAQGSGKFEKLMLSAFVESHPCAKDAQGWGTRQLGEALTFSTGGLVCR